MWSPRYRSSLKSFSFVPTRILFLPVTPLGDVILMTGWFRVVPVLFTYLSSLIFPVSVRGNTGLVIQSVLLLLLKLFWFSRRSVLNLIVRLSTRFRWFSGLTSLVLLTIILTIGTNMMVLLLLRVPRRTIILFIPVIIIINLMKFVKRRVPSFNITVTIIDRLRCLVVIMVPPGVLFLRKPVQPWFTFFTRLRRLRFMLELNILLILDLLRLKFTVLRLTLGLTRRRAVTFMLPNSLKFIRVTPRLISSRVLRV